MADEVDEDEYAYVADDDADAEAATAAAAVELDEAAIAATAAASAIAASYEKRAIDPDIRAAVDAALLDRGKYARRMLELEDEQYADQLQRAEYAAVDAGAEGEGIGHVRNAIYVPAAPAYSPAPHAFSTSTSSTSSSSSSSSGAAAAAATAAAARIVYSSETFSPVTCTSPAEIDLAGAVELRLMGTTIAVGYADASHASRILKVPPENEPLAVFSDMKAALIATRVNATMPNPELRSIEFLGTSTTYFWFAPPGAIVKICPCAGMAATRVFMVLPNGRNFDGIHNGRAETVQERWFEWQSAARATTIFAHD